MSRQKTQHNWFSYWQQDLQNRERDKEEITLSQQRAQELQNSIQDAIMYGTSVLLTEYQQQGSVTVQRVHPYDIFINPSSGFKGYEYSTISQDEWRKGFPKKSKRKKRGHTPDWL